MRNLTIGERIKNARKNKKMSQKELSRMINVSPSTLSRYEHNAFKGIDINILNEIADALGVSSKYLQGYTKVISEKILTVRLVEGFKDGEFVTSSKIDVASFGLPSKNLFYLIADDNSMAPLIRKEALVLFEITEDAIDDSIVCILPNDTQVPVIRKLCKVNNQILFLPLDFTKYIYINDAEKSHKILGRAIQVTHDL